MNSPLDIAAWFATVEGSNPEAVMVFRSVRASTGEIIDFEWLYSNPAAERIAQRTHESLVGQRLLVEMPGNKASGLFDAYSRVVETGEPFAHHFHYAYEGLDNWFRTLSTRFQDGFVVRFSDVTASHRLEQEREQLLRELREREASYRRLAEHLPDVVARLDRQGRHLYVSPNIQRITRSPTELFLGKTNAELGMPPELVQRWDQALASVFERGQPEGLDFTFPGQDGEPMHFHSTLVPERDESGTIVSVLAIARDETERRRREEQLRQAVELEQLFVGIVGHDLRNPLSAILTSAELLQRRLKDEPSSRAASRIVSSAKRASRIIHDLLDFSRVQLGQGLPMDPRPSDLHALVRRVFEEHEASHPGRRLELVQHGPGEGVWDPARLEQAVANLLSNALSYSPPDSPVRLESEGLAEEVLVWVHNQGPPIPPELLSRLFEPFSRTSHELEPRGSLGLGLFIVSQVVKGHGGRIDVSSTAEEGTRFTLRLPRVARPASSSSRSRPGS